MSATPEPSSAATAEPEAAGKPVFISYSSKDADIALAIRTAVEKEGIDVWMAPRDAVPGRHYSASIIDAINGCKLVVLVFSPNANGSGQVLREVERAVSKGIPIVTFRIADVAMSKEMEYFLSSQHWIDACARPIGPCIEHLAGLMRSLKNKAFQFEPVGSGYRVAITPPAPSSILSRLTSPANRRQALAFGAGTVVALGGAGAWWLTSRTPPTPPAPPPPTINTLGTLPAVAVLPFRNLTTRPEAEFLSQSMAAELSAALARGTSLIVRPLSSVRIYADKSWLEIAKLLSANTIIQGTITSAEPSFRILLEINDARQNAEIWSDVLQGVGDTLTLTDQMIAKVTSALHLRLENTPEYLGTSNKEAYDRFLKAVSLMEELNDANNKAAIGFLEDATRRDPRFARGLAKLAQCYVTRYWWNFSNDRRWLDLAESTARSALRLDSELVEAQVALAYAFEAKGRRQDAARAYVRSAALDPQNIDALVNLARYLFYMSAFEKALAVLDRIAAIDPTQNVAIRRAQCLFFLGQLERSRNENTQALQRARGIEQFTLIAFTAAWLKDFANAKTILDRLKAQQPDALSILEVEAWLATMKGDVAAAHAAMDTIRARRAEFGILDELATLYAIQGDRTRAAALLETAVKAGAPNYAWYKSDFFKQVRGEPRYESALHELESEYRAVLRDYRG